MKAVLVTGAGSGLGHCCVQKFATEGWNVVATMRRLAPKATNFDPSRVLVRELDVTVPETIRDALQAGIARFGRIDVVVNNAGYGLAGVFETFSQAAVQRQFDVNCFGVMNVCREILPHFREHRSGVIVNVTSAAGVFGIPATSIYAASKFALEGFSEAISYELLSQNILVKIIEPGGMGGTKFHESSMQASGEWPTEGDYRDFAEKAKNVFSSMAIRPYPPAARVADVIFRAASDGSDQLRYVAGEDIRPLVALRRSSSEERFMAQMRAMFRFH